MLEADREIENILRKQRFKDQNKRNRCIFEDENQEYAIVDEDDEKEMLNRTKRAIELRRSRIERIFIGIQAARNVYLCFLLDVTCSMMKYITEVKNSIYTIIDKLTRPTRRILSGSQQTAEKMHVSLVAYRDYGDRSRFEILPFTDSIKEFHDFCDELRAEGGRDVAEDVLGGLNKAITLKWSPEAATKVIFHIADAPAHGAEFNNYQGGIVFRIVNFESSKRKAISVYALAKIRN